MNTEQSICWEKCPSCSMRVCVCKKMVRCFCGAELCRVTVPFRATATGHDWVVIR